MLDKFPGSLWYDGIFAIHADWPTYPPGIGWEVALRSLGQFPIGTCFYEIDDIDKCKLLCSKDPKNLENKYDPKHFHIAVWHEDLIELKKRGLVEGVMDKTEYEFDLLKFEKIRTDLRLKEDCDGNLIMHFRDSETGEIQSATYDRPINEDPDEEYQMRNWVVIENTIKLTSLCVDELIRLSEKVRLPKQVDELISPFLTIERYDTAVREASLLVETTIKNFHHRPDLYGQKLIDYHVEQIVKHNDNFNSAAIKTYQIALRTIFKFIRNDYAHNFKVITRPQCNIILSRIIDILVEFEEVKNAYFNKSKP